MDINYQTLLDETLRELRRAHFAFILTEQNRAGLCFIDVNLTVSCQKCMYMTRDF